MAGSTGSGADHTDAASAVDEPISASEATTASARTNHETRTRGILLAIEPQSRPPPRVRHNRPGRGRRVCWLSSSVVLQPTPTAGAAISTWFAHREVSSIHQKACKSTSRRPPAKPGKQSRAIRWLDDRVRGHGTPHHGTDALVSCSRPGLMSDTEGKAGWKLLLQLSKQRAEYCLCVNFGCGLFSAARRRPANLYHEVQP
jgi:hypothetical protein